MKTTNLTFTSLIYGERFNILPKKVQRRIKDCKDDLDIMYPNNYIVVDATPDKQMSVFITKKYPCDILEEHGYAQCYNLAEIIASFENKIYDTYNTTKIKNPYKMSSTDIEFFIAELVDKHNDKSKNTLNIVS